MSSGRLEVGWEKVACWSTKASNTGTYFFLHQPPGSYRPSTHVELSGDDWGGDTPPRPGIRERERERESNTGISETRKDRGKLPWRAYKKSPTLFRTVPYKRFVSRTVVDCLVECEARAVTGRAEVVVHCGSLERQGMFLIGV